MKSTTTLFALFLLCAFFTSYLPSATAQFVLDTDGNPLQNGGIYYVAPAEPTANGGGIEYAAFGSEYCPFFVAKSHDPSCMGIPITISNPDSILYISEGLSVSTGFTFRPPSCVPTSQWTIVNDQQQLPLPEGALVVQLTGDNNNNAVPGWFKIERVPVKTIKGYNYNLLFCPLDDSPCGYVGAYNDPDFQNRRLVVTQREENRMWIRFVKHKEYASTSTHSTA